MKIFSFMACIAALEHPLCPAYAYRGPAASLKSPFNSHDTSLTLIGLTPTFCLKWWLLRWQRPLNILNLGSLCIMFFANCMEIFTIKDSLILVSIIVWWSTSPFCLHCCFEVHFLINLVKQSWCFLINWAHDQGMRLNLCRFKKVFLS